ncbi:MAG: hypothetical protein AAGH68_13420 [Pseudomonadota bacterium]
MTYMMTDKRTGAFPTITSYDVATVLFAGAAATVAFDLFGQFISPLLKSVTSPWLGAKLAPVPLAQTVLAKLTGIPGKELRALGIPYGMHILTGLLLYPLAWMTVVRPIWQRVAPSLHWSLPAIAYGIGLWVFALYGMAHLVAGMKPFLGFGSITWVALWGHILFAVVAAGVIEARRTR